MIRAWKRDVSVPGRWNVQSITLRSRWTGSAYSLTMTQAEVGQVPVKTRAVFGHLSDAYDYADELDEALRAEGWQRVN